MTSPRRVIAFEVGHCEKAIEYGRYAVLMDLGDIGGNVRDGCNMASMGATWMVLVNGYAGMDLDPGHNSVIRFLPDGLRTDVRRVELVGLVPVEVGLFDEDRFHVVTVFHFTAKLLPHAARIIEGIV